MKVVALLSGGKDSIYNLLHCILNDHEPIAVASLGPGKGKDELDSYMYQTVGHSGLSLIAEALSLPFYTRTILGTAVNQQGEYGSREGLGPRMGVQGDETEDLYELLKDVKGKEPSVQAVAVGAILSNYQRVRVEHVCSRLGLVPIAYLWERNQEELLGEMVRAGMESVLVKVAGAGLGVEHLGKSLKEMQPTLHRLNKKYQLHVCGEGGEYETFTVDCPIFKQRIIFDKTTRVVSNSDPYSTVAHLHLDECSLVPKPNHPQNETFEQLKERLSELVTVPPLLDEPSVEIFEVAKASYATSSLASLSLADVDSSLTRSRDSPKSSGSTSTHLGPWLHFSEITSPSSASEPPSIESEVRSCFESLISLLSSHSTSLLSISHLTIYLSPTSMSLFPRINAIYSSYFGVSPPTRACVSIHLPQGIRVKLEGVAYVPSSTGSRTSLHVQSLSYWASANIGPYSQSITLDRSRLFVAGQIGLVPASLQLPSTPDVEAFAKQAALSLQHLRRIVLASFPSSVDGSQGWCEGGLCWLQNTTSPSEWARQLASSRAAWRTFSDLIEGGKQAPMLYLSAEALPRGAKIEWQVVWSTARREEEEEGDSDEEDSRGVEMKESWRTEVRASDMVVMCSESRGVAKVVTALIACSASTTMEERFDLGPSVGEILAIRAVHKPCVSVEQAILPTISYICSERLATAQVDDHDLAFLITASTT